MYYFFKARLLLKCHYRGRVGWGGGVCLAPFTVAIKAQNYHFVSKISQIFYFQNLKLARLKPVSKSKALTCTLCSYDPKEAPNMISSHSDCFRALNAPFFLQPQISSFRI